MGVNSVTLVGRAGRDPEVRYFESGSVVANLTLAVNRRSRDDEPDWFNLEIWGKQAQVAADYVRKGSLIGVVGRMTSEQWTDRNTGERRSKALVKVDRLALLGSRAESAATAGPAAGSAAPQGTSTAALPQATDAPPAGNQGWSGTPISNTEVPF